jgi:hypothetical protein
MLIRKENLNIVGTALEQDQTAGAESNENHSEKFRYQLIETISILLKCGQLCVGRSVFYDADGRRQRTRYATCPPES